MKIHFCGFDDENYSVVQSLNSTQVFISNQSCKKVVVKSHSYTFFTAFKTSSHKKSDYETCSNFKPSNRGFELANQTFSIMSTHKDLEIV